MDAYVYQAALHCEECAAEIMKVLGRDLDADYDDSDSFPQGPYPNGGGESDVPSHCDSCGTFLENPLTDDGYAYVREQLAGDGNPEVLELWADFYGIRVAAS